MARRSFILGMGAVVAGYSALRYGPAAIGDLLAPPFDFEPLTAPAGFRKITAGQSSAGVNPLVGLDLKGQRQDAQIVAQVRDDLCAVLFEGKDRAGTVPVASFSDYNCPYCRVLTELLAKIEARGKISVAWHEWPLLGPTSRIAAKGAIAAKRQGAYAIFHKRLMRGRFQATEGYLKALAQSMDLEADQFIADFHDPLTDETIARSSALAGVFGFIGTPSLVVGRTVVQGAISEAALERLIAQETNDGPVAVCS